MVVLVAMVDLVIIQVVTEAVMEGLVEEATYTN